MKKALLLVSFGTSHADTREKTLDVLLREMEEAFPDRKVVRAWTSRMILKKIRERDGLMICSVPEAMAAMAAEGVEDLVVQPTHFINGIENEQMMADVMAYGDRIPKIVCGDALLATHRDNEQAIHSAMKRFPLKKEEAMVWMGHGTTHQANEVYHEVNRLFGELGYPRTYMATVEEYPSLEPLFEEIRGQGARKVILAPFMMVAGDHAKNDMSGEEPDSWKNQFAAAGFEVACCLEGLGENPAVREMFIAHARAAAASAESAEK